MLQIITLPCIYRKTIGFCNTKIYIYKKWTLHDVLHNLFLFSFRLNIVPTAYRAVSTSSNNMSFENRVSEDNGHLSDQCRNWDYMSTVHTKLGANVLLKEVTQNIKPYTFLSSVELKQKWFKDCASGFFPCGCIEQEALEAVMSDS